MPLAGWEMAQLPWKQVGVSQKPATRPHTTQQFHCRAQTQESRAQARTHVDTAPARRSPTALLTARKCERPECPAADGRAKKGGLRTQWNMWQ